MLLSIPAVEGRTSVYVSGRAELPLDGPRIDLIVFETGVLMEREELEEASRMCSRAGAWLVVDNTYEHFTYDGATHHCVSGPHVINMFSFSKVSPALE